MNTLIRAEAVLLWPLALVDALVGRLLAPPLIEQALAPAPALTVGTAPPPIDTLTVVELRRLAQSRGIRQAGGIRTSKARRAALLEVLA
jgi:hypothetical protein